MELKIETVSNGFILRAEDETTVYQDIEFLAEDGGAIQSTQELLSKILEYVGPPTSRHSAQRIYIEVRPGDKFENGTEIVEE